MYPRLQLLKKFLTKDGGIFVSIDYNEEANLRLLLDEIFGARNYRNTFIVSRIKKNIKEREKVKSVNFGHNSVVFYANSDDCLIIPPTKIQDKPQRWHAFDAPGIRPTMEYELFGHKPPQNRHWMYSKERAFDMIEKGFLRPNPKSGKPQYHLEESSETMLDTNWTDLQEAGFSWNFPYGEKNKELIKRILKMITDQNSIIMDSFAGSGTTAHAVLDLNKVDNGNRRCILIEMEEEVCKNITAERVRKLISSDKDKIGEELNIGFRYCKLGEPLFDKLGCIRKEVKFDELASHIYFSETGTPLPENSSFETPLIGICNNTAYYLLYNGILKDKSLSGGNVLTSKTLEHLPSYNGNKVIFGEANKISQGKLSKDNIIFKQIPYEIKLS